MASPNDDDVEFADEAGFADEAPGSDESDEGSALSAVDSHIDFAGAAPDNDEYETDLAGTDDLRQDLADDAGSEASYGFDAAAEAGSHNTEMGDSGVQRELGEDTGTDDDSDDAYQLPQDVASADDDVSYAEESSSTDPDDDFYADAPIPGEESASDSIGFADDAASGYGDEIASGYGEDVASGYGEDVASGYGEIEADGYGDPAPAAEEPLADPGYSDSDPGYSDSDADDGDEPAAVGFGSVEDEDEDEAPAGVSFGSIEDPVEAPDDESDEMSAPTKSVREPPKSGQISKNALDDIFSRAAEIRRKP